MTPQEVRLDLTAAAEFVVYVGLYALRPEQAAGTRAIR
jgi:hypothetical protein